MQNKIAIIGAGPAGSVAAVLLARANLPVTLIEQHRFPRDKVCGECISAMGVDVLGRIGALDRIIKSGAISLRRANVFSQNGSSLKLDLPRTMLGISRAKLDQILLEMARESGVLIRQPARIEQIQNGKLAIRDIESNRVEDIVATQILIADGKSHHREAVTDIGIKAHFENVSTPREAIELFGVSGSYGGIAPIEDGAFNISFSIPAHRIHESRGDIDALFDEVVNENRALRDRMKRARRISDWLTAPLHRSRVRPFDPCMIPIGNAAASIEPIGGEGIGLAMRSAELAANAILNSTVPALHKEYRHLWRTRRIACRSAALVLSRPLLANFLLDGIDGHESLFASILHLVGKSPALA